MSSVSVPKIGTPFIISTLGFIEGSLTKKCYNLKLDVLEVLEYSTNLDVFFVRSQINEEFFECYIKQNMYTKLWYIYDRTTPIEIKEKERST